MPRRKFGKEVVFFVFRVDFGRCANEELLVESADSAVRNAAYMLNIVAWEIKSARNAQRYVGFRLVVTHWYHKNAAFESDWKHCNIGCDCVAC